MLLAILVAQEEILTVFPNIQLTTVLIMVYAVVLPIPSFLMITLSYVLLDNLIIGSMNPIYMIPMAISWILLGLVSYAFKKKPLWTKVLIGALFAVFYGWSFIPGNMLIQHITNVWAYIQADIPFEMIMAVTNVITILFFYEPLEHLLRNLYEQPYKLDKS